MMYAVKHNQISVLQTMRVKDWRIHDYDHMGRSCLHLAASEGHLTIFNFLLANGGNIDHVDVLGNTVLNDAVRENKTEVIESIYYNFPEKY
jgi:ankyrin repeat protein